MARTDYIPKNYEKMTPLPLPVAGNLDDGATLCG
jgi:hypothetical protein